MLLIKFIDMIRIRIKQFTKIQKQLEDPKGLIKYSNNMQNVYQNIAEYNPIWCNILIYDC